MRRLLSIGTLLVLSACATGAIPPPPQGDTCIVDVAANGADCAPISTASDLLVRSINEHQESMALIQRIKALSVPGAFVNFSEMDNYVCFSPDSWGNIQTWIGEVVSEAQRRCQ